MMKRVNGHARCGMNALIVDDSPDDAKLLTRQLTSAGYQVEVARDGREAIEIIRLGAHRLVITDWNMPVMDGIELCHTVRSEEQVAYVYMILLTSRGTPQSNPVCSP